MLVMMIDETLMYLTGSNKNNVRMKNVKDDTDCLHVNNLHAYIIQIREIQI